MSRLILRYEYDRTPPVDDLGWLAAQVQTERYSGSGGFWVQWQDVVEFADLLKQYPLPSDAPIRAQWGFEMQEANDLILSIEVAAANATGDLVVRVEMADHLFPEQRLRTSFTTAYAEVASFADALTGVMAKGQDEAVLSGK
jgi:hypothetical protein